MNDEMQQLTQHYNQIVETYQTVHHTLSRLLDEYGGTELMPPDIRTQYHDLARQRDEIFDEMRQIELALFSDSNTDL